MSVRRSAALLLLTGCLLSVSLPAQPPESPRDRLPPDEWRARQERWERLPSAQRRQLLERHERWQHLPAGEREALRERLKRFEQLPPGEREVLQRRLRTWLELTPEQQEQMRRRLEYWRRQPPGEKERIARALWILKNLLSDEFESFKLSTGREHEQQRRPLARKLQTLLAVPTEELRRVKELPPEARQNALDQLLRRRRPGGSDTQRPSPDNRARAEAERPEGLARPEGPRPQSGGK